MIPLEFSATLVGASVASLIYTLAWSVTSVRSLTDPGVGKRGNRSFHVRFGHADWNDRMGRELIPYERDYADAGE